MNLTDMKITIDEKICTKYKMTVPEVLLALAVRHQGDEEILENLINREVLIRPDKQAPLVTYMVTQHWSDVLDEILAESSGYVERTDEELIELAKKMRELYPQGRMLDRRTGQPTAYYFRCNTTEIVKKLKTFFMRYGNYSDEDILDAEKRYVASYRGNYQQKGFRLIKYFIFKDDVKQGPDGNYIEPLSPLLDFLENKESEEEGVSSDEWTSKMI